MDWVERVRGTVVAVDTAPLIYYIEERPIYIRVVAPLFEAVAAGEVRAVFSTVTLLEVLVHPLRDGDHELAARYAAILRDAENVSLVDVDAEIAEGAALLRAQYGFRTPDAVQLATARAEDAMFFVTNDPKLARVDAPKVIVVDEINRGTAFA